jgi:hypothetical protein
MGPRVFASLDVLPELVEGNPPEFTLRVRAALEEWISRRVDSSECVLRGRADAMTCDAYVHRGWLFGVSVYVARTVGTARLDVLVARSSPLSKKLFLRLDAALVAAGFIFLLSGAAQPSEGSGYMLLAMCLIGLVPIVLLQLLVAAVTNPVTRVELEEIHELVTERLTTK